MSGYFEASYRGGDKSIYGWATKIRVHIHKKLLGGYIITPCRGHEMKQMTDLSINYSSLDDLIDDWELIRSFNPDDIYLGR